MSVLLLIVGLLLFVGLVIVHEFGHFIMARRGGVAVEEFGLGFPPRAKVIAKRNGTKYTLNWLPLGGFVRLKGEHDADKSPGSYGAASLKTKTKIMAAGVVMNLLAAFVLLTGLAWIGTPVLICHQFTVKSDTRIVSDSRQVLVGDVLPDTPASSIGLQKGDQILAAGRTPQTLQPVQSQCPFADTTKDYAGQALTLQYKRGSHIYQKTVQLLTTTQVAASQKTDHPKGYLGISVDQSGFALQRSTWSAPITALGFMKQVTILTLKGVGSALVGLGKYIKGIILHNNALRSQGNQEATSQVSGPVGIFELLKDGSILGYQFMLVIIALISLTLAIMNILPIPALDGGRLFVTMLFKAVRRPLKQRTEDIIHGTGFLALMVLFVLITIVDVHRFF